MEYPLGKVREMNAPTYFHKDQCNRGSGCGHCNMTAREKFLMKTFRMTEGPWSIRYTIGKHIRFKEE
jgi:hypothetical protein